jgi:hypothetical protein
MLLGVSAGIKNGAETRVVCFLATALRLPFQNHVGIRSTHKYQRTYKDSSRLQPNMLAIIYALWLTMGAGSDLQRSTAAKGSIASPWPELDTYQLHSVSEESFS